VVQFGAEAVCLKSEEGLGHLHDLCFAQPPLPALLEERQQRVFAGTAGGIVLVEDEAVSPGVVRGVPQHFVVVGRVGDLDRGAGDGV
ncbi:MAG: hypothetical protein ACK55I_44390, partial [bacterium]